jgi:hypothetical protein
MANVEIVDTRPIPNRIVEFMVQATEFELRCLKETWQHQIFSWEYAPKTLGLPETANLGSVAGVPITIDIIWVCVGGHVIGFYRPTSRIVDYDMIERWIDSALAPRRGENLTLRTGADHFWGVIETLGIDLKATCAED